MLNAAKDPAELAEVRASLAILLRDTDEMCRIHGTAETYARLPRRSLQVRELVADVIGDAFSGVLSSLPNCLAKQIHDEVRQRARRISRTRAYPVSLTALHEEQLPLVPSAHETLTSGDDDYPALADMPQLIGELRERARDDVPVLQLLALYEQGLFRRSDARRIMSIHTYRAARERLHRLVLAVTSAKSVEHEILAPSVREADTTPLLPRHRLGPRRATRRTAVQDHDRRSA